MKISSDTVVNIDGVIYREKNGLVTINGREVHGIEAERAKADMVATRGRISALTSSIRNTVRSLWR